ncbi:MAG: tRNA lysidine(34) synthetase TilS, partial [Candidatus Binatia bacterium]
CRDEDALLDNLARQRHAAMFVANGLARQAFLTQPRALQRRILRLWIEQTRGDLRGLEFVHIEEILRLIHEGPPQGRASIPGGWEFVRQYETLKLAKRYRSSRRVCYNYYLEIGAVLAIPEAGLELHSKRMPAPLQQLPGDPSEAILDLAAVTEPLAVRNFRPGDRFQPLGMSGHKKVKDLFIEKRVPLSVRGRWPLLASGGEILWIPCYGRSAMGRVSEKTTSILHVKAQWVSS